MSPQEFQTLTLANGLRVVVQPMRGVQSAALALMIPAGAVFDQDGRSGTTAILADMLPRGAGELSARELSSRMDNIGLQRSISGGVRYLNVSAATTADRLVDAIALIADQVCRPHLAEDQFAAAQGLVVQGLNAIEDEPRQLLGHALRRCSYPAPYGHPAEGTLADVPSITIDDIRRHHQNYVSPGQAVLGVAGNVSVDQLREPLEQAFGDWQPRDVSLPEPTAPQPAPLHLEHDSAQTHIGLAWESVPYPHERYFESWAAISILSGGMSSRLFTEVREKRGLCYAVSASLTTQVDQARVLGYAGATNDRAQETLDVMVAEIRRLHEDLTEDELQRCKARAKSTLIMQQESTMSRAGSLARDTLYLGHAVPLEEIRARIDALTVPQVRDYIVDHAPGEIVLVTIGPKSLDAECVQAPAVNAG